MAALIVVAGPGRAGSGLVMGRRFCLEWWPFVSACCNLGRALENQLFSMNAGAFMAMIGGYSLCPI